MGQIPRGWAPGGSGSGSGGNVSLVLPAAAGITHVLTHIDALILITGTASPFGTVATVSEGVTIVIQPFELLTNPVAAGSFLIDSNSWDGEYMINPGSALTLSFSAALPAAGCAMFANIRGYDI